MNPIIIYHKTGKREGAKLQALCEPYTEQVLHCSNLDDYCQLLAEVDMVHTIIFWDLESSEELIPLLQLAQQTYDQEIILLIADQTKHSRTRLRSVIGHHHLYLIPNSQKTLKSTLEQSHIRWSQSQNYAPDPTIIKNLLKVGQEALVQKLIRLFLKETPIKIIHAQLAAEEGDIEQVFHIFHAVKGSCAMLGLMRLSQEAGKIEQQALMNSSSTSMLARNQLDYGIQEFLPKFDLVLQSLKQLSKDITEKAEHEQALSRKIPC